MERIHLEIILMLLISLLTLSAYFTKLELFGYDTTEEKNISYFLLYFLSQSVLNIMHAKMPP